MLSQTFCKVGTHILILSVRLSLSELALHGVSAYLWDIYVLDWGQLFAKSEMRESGTEGLDLY